MKQTRIVHFVAGTLILTGLLLGYYVNGNWLWLSGFIGFNLLQHSITNWCPLIIILRKLGIGDCSVRPKK